jgi:NAD(P)-dependent dehydrogenase (short-subunit alcohol dehydrogenase family)
MTKAVLPAMRRQRSGHVVMVSSIGGLASAATISSYNASKHALEGWSESLLGIKAVLVEPGSFQTDIWTRGAVMGKNAIKETSPNYQRSLRMREAVQKIRKRDPIEVARVIVGIAQDPNPRLRYLVGPRCPHPTLDETASPLEVAREVDGQGGKVGLRLELRKCSSRGRTRCPLLACGCAAL